MPDAAQPGIEIPEDLVVRLWHRGLPSMLPAEFTMFPARRLTETIPVVTGVYDGNTGYAEWPDPPFILFDFSWLSVGGQGMERIGGMAARIAGMLASRDPDWPGTEAHVRLLPVIDMRLMYRATPAWAPEGDDGSARIRALADQLGWLDGAAGLAVASLMADGADVTAT